MFSLTQQGLGLLTSALGALNGKEENGDGSDKDEVDSNVDEDGNASVGVAAEEEKKNSGGRLSAAAAFEGSTSSSAATAAAAGLNLLTLLPPSALLTTSSATSPNPSAPEGEEDKTKVTMAKFLARYGLNKVVCKKVDAHLEKEFGVDSWADLFFLDESDVNKVLQVVAKEPYNLRKVPLAKLAAALKQVLYMRK